MKNNILLPLFYFVVGGLCGQSSVKPDYVAYYAFYSPTDTTTLTLTPADDYILMAHRGVSRFQSAHAHFNDSMSYEYKLKNPELNNPTSQEEVQGIVDRYMAALNQWSKKVKSQFMVVKEFDAAIVKSKLDQIMPPEHLEFPLLSQWQMAGSTDTVAGLPCQRATIHYGGRDYTAWFAPGIPVADGPYVFSGLPGLIVKIADSRGWYTFELKSFHPKPAKHFWNENFLHPLSAAISREQYVHKTEKYMKNPRMPGVINQSEESILRQKKAYASRYYMLLERY